MFPGESGPGQVQTGHTSRDRLKFFVQLTAREGTGGSSRAGQPSARKQAAEANLIVSVIYRDVGFEI